MAVLQAILPIFALIVLGYVLGRRRWLGNQTRCAASLALQGGEG